MTPRSGTCSGCLRPQRDDDRRSGRVSEQGRHRREQLGRAERLREDRRLLETAGQSLPSVAGGEGERNTFLRQRRRDFADRVAAEIGVDESGIARPVRSEEHTSELQSLMRISYAVFCLKIKKITTEADFNTHQRTNNT